MAPVGPRKPAERGMMSRIQCKTFTDSTQVYAGIDVSKASLDLHILAADGAGFSRRFANSGEGIAVLAACLGSGPCRVAFEPTGRFRLALWRALDAMGHEAVPLNPFRARRLLGQQICLIEAQLSEIEAELTRLIDADPALARRRDILASIPGFGAVSVNALIAELPEFNPAHGGAGRSPLQPAPQGIPRQARSSREAREGSPHSSAQKARHHRQRACPRRQTMDTIKALT